MSHHTPTRAMFRRKSASISTPETAGVYRPHPSHPVPPTLTVPPTLNGQLTSGGRPNPAFVPDHDSGHPTGQLTSNGDICSGDGGGDSGGGRNCDGGGGGDGSSSVRNGSTPTNSKEKPGSGGQEVTVEMEAAQLKKSINLLHCTAILVAVTGHAAIFVSPAAILGVTGSLGASLLVWLTGGLINLGMALCFAELGTMMPEAGGPYAYVLKTFGPLPGFLIMWGYVVLIAGPFWAFQAYTAALYIVKPFFPDCQLDGVMAGVRLLAGWIMITLVGVNCVYMKYVTKVQTLLSSTKLIALLIIIGVGVHQLSSENTDNFESMFEGTTEEPGQWAVAIFYSIFSYGGWQILTALMEEVKRPERDLPVSVYLTFSLVIALYILTTVAYYTVLSPYTLLHTDAVALLFMQRVYPPLVPLIAVLVATTCIGALNASIMGHSRLLFAGARKGHMPVIMGMVHPRYLTPWPAIFTLLAWSLAMLYSGSLVGMMEYISLFSTIMGVTVVCALLYLRWTRPDDTRPYRTSVAVPLAQLVINVAVLVLGVYQRPHRMGTALAILSAGIPVYWLGVLWRSKPPEFTQLVHGLTVFAQKVLVLVKTG